MFKIVPHKHSLIHLVRLVFPVLTLALLAQDQLMMLV